MTTAVNRGYSPEVLDPATNAPVNPTTITVHLQAGFPLGEVKSHFHDVKIDNPDSATRVITLASSGASSPLSAISTSRSS